MTREEYEAFVTQHGRAPLAIDFESDALVVEHFTMLYLRMIDGYVGIVAELRGANAQGKTLDETRRNLREAVALILNR